MLIEKARRLAHSYRNCDNYRLRMLLAAAGPHPPLPREDDMTTLKSEEPRHHTSLALEDAGLPPVQVAVGTRHRVPGEAGDSARGDGDRGCEQRVHQSLGK